MTETRIPTRRQVADWSRLTQKKFRRESGLFVIEGEVCVREALRTTVDVQAVLMLGTEEERFQRLLSLSRSPIYCLTTAELSRITHLETSQGIAAIGRQFTLPARPGKLALACEQVSDPGNGGALIRVADFFGATEVFFGPDSTEIWNPKVVRGSMGSLFHQPVREEVDLMKLISTWNGSSVACVAHGGESLRKRPRLQSPVLLVLGHETRGLSEELAARCTHRITLDPLGHAESLNLVTAAAVFCYALSDAA